MFQILLMSSDPLLAIAKLLLPEVLIEYFDLTNHKAQAEEIHFYFKEDNITPTEFKDQKLTSKGFFAEATLQDFPIRGNRCSCTLLVVGGLMKPQVKRFPEIGD